MARAAATTPEPRQRMFCSRIMTGVAYMALSIAGLVAVKVIELRLPASRHRSIVAMLRVEPVVDVAVKALSAVKPGAGSKEYASYKPIGAVVAIRRAVIGLIVEVSIGANRRRSYLNGNLCRRIG